ncbi:hypothetical protein CHS0354_039184 [Potamilus streckersoni]|uniref:Uncharacterized protein n=1 Tax=Potamilus streckersoni TaxID=2493646 RepID=A0AAE0TEI8_9BIVA|nr:hypothetical protein CHS0354_039184 [Potamilus streckersoni]
MYSIRNHCKMKIILAVVLLGLVALTMAQDNCANDAECQAHCNPHSGHCNGGVCHCDHNARQAPCEGHTCTCPDGSQGHCDHNGVCHCHS